MNYKTLKQCTVFHDLAEKEIAEKIEQIPYSIQSYKKGETIIRSGETANQIGFILSGHAEVQKIYGFGNQVNVTVRKAGDLIGPAAVFAKAGRYPCDIVAREEMNVILIRKADMIALMESDRRIMNNFLEALASATFMLQQKIEMMSYSSIAQKIAFTLLVYYHQTGKTRFPIPESITKWAMQLNVSRPSLHRELKKMQGKNMIHYDPPFIEILDSNELEKLIS